MSAKSGWVLILASVSVLGACQSSPPTHYFAMTQITPTAPRASWPAPIPIRIERVTIPDELDRLEFVRRTTSNRLQISTFDLWAAPLEGMIRRVIGGDLTARLAAGAMASDNEPAGGEPRRHLYIDVQEFTGDEHGAVTLHAAWLIQTANAASLRGTEEINVAASDATADSLAAAMSRALADFADRIAAALAPQAGSEKSA
jgi:uncharacterized lipoprotein YmbA